MATQLSIINLALSHLAVASIAATTEGSVSAQTAMRVWDPARKECLRGHDWSFATVVATLTISATYGTLTTSGLYAGNYIYAYEYPSNCLAMWHVYDETIKDKSIGLDFRELYDQVNSKKIIVTNVYSALGEYTFDVEDPAFFDATFVTVLSYRLAADMAMPLTGDDKKAASMLKVFIALMNDAKRISSGENNPVHVSEGPSAFVDSRGEGQDSNSYYNPNNPHLNG